MKLFRDGADYTKLIALFWEEKKISREYLPSFSKKDSQDIKKSQFMSYNCSSKLAVFQVTASKCTMPHSIVLKMSIILNSEQMTRLPI